MNSSHPGLTFIYRFAVVVLLGAAVWKLHLIETKTRLPVTAADFVAIAGSAGDLRRLSMSLPLVQVSGTVTVDGAVDLKGPLELNEPVSVTIQR